MSDDRIIHSQQPYNAEPALPLLRSSPITTADMFYVRSHGDTPAVDPASYILEVGGLVETKLSLSLSELRAFPQTRVEATMQCAGNRRADMLGVRPVAGDPWSAGAIGNAIWSGVKLADLLQAARAEMALTHHVGFSSLDEIEMDGNRFNFGASIPMGKALSPNVLVALDMNDAPLAPSHGFPVRIVTPGFAGVRSPKWLYAIEVRDSPSVCPVQAEDYKLLPADIERVEDIDWSRGITINDLPVNSAICEPAPETILPAGRTLVRGWAMATGRLVVRVDVSADGGATWMQAECESDPSLWSWTFWSAQLELAAGRHELAVRAWDEAGQTQPADAVDTWNVKGYLSAAWHRVRVTVR